MKENVGGIIIILSRGGIGGGERHHPHFAASICLSP